MPKRNSKRLVIDASVARAAGGVEAVKPQPKSCRDFLTTTMKSGHQLVLTSEIRQEWNRHQSRFAQAWRSSMVAKKQVAFVPDESLSDLTNELDSLSVTDKQLMAMQKDALLVESAIATDKTVIALDDRVRNLFARASTTISTLRQIIWVNPVISDEAPLSWLKNGAPPEAHRQLGNYNQPN